MYRPSEFNEDRIEVLHQAMRDIAFGTLVTIGADGLIASHIPLLLEDAPAPLGNITGHLARANPQARSCARERGARDLLGASHLRHALLVSEQGGDGAGGADLELCRGPRLWKLALHRQSGLEARACDAPHALAGKQARSALDGR